MATTLAVQLYTLRDHCKTPADIARSLKRCADIGYKAVQASALGPIEPKELKKILDDNGLTCCATHEPLDALLNQSTAVVDKHRILDCAYTAVGGFFPKPEESTRENWQKFVADFNRAASNFKGSGVALGYHNHSHEFASFAPTGGETIWDMLLKTLDCDIWIEVDTYWVQHGGGDPAAWIERLAGRVPCVHLKDLGMAMDRSHQMRSVGGGNMNWDRILDACFKTGVRWFIVEQDHTYGLDPFECLKASYAYLRGTGLE